MANENELDRKLETETCSRCGGCGRYSYCQRFGDTCFKCSGVGKVYTKRGQAAADFLKTLRRKRADQFKIGELFFMESGPCNSAQFCEIESIFFSSRRRHTRYIGDWSSDVCSSD